MYYLCHATCKKEISFNLGMPCEPATVPAAVILVNSEQKATANICGKAF